MRLAGKTALVTGAGRGIGKAIAVAFAEEGANLALLARSADELEAVAVLIRALGRDALVVKADVTDQAAVEAAVADTLRHFGAIDILVNNAGYAFFGYFVDTPVDEWRKTIDINLHGVMHCAKAVIPSMIERKSGRIINISSVAGTKPTPEHSAYCASKYAVNGFSKVLALELKEYGISVHALCPGGVETQLVQNAPAHRARENWMEPEDIAHSAVYLATLPPMATVDELIVRRYHSRPY